MLTPFLVLIAFFVGMIILSTLVDRWLTPKGTYELWLEKELKSNPDYIYWLKEANNGKHYKLGLKVLKRIL